MATLNRTMALLLVAGAGASVFAQDIICSGAELFAKPSQVVKYGRWEVRMQTAAVPGSVSSFFTYYDSSWMKKPEPWREIDIEVLGNAPNSFQSNLITGMVDPASSAPNQGKITSEKHHSVNGMSSTFHTFTLDWTPDSIVWRVDGQVLRKNGANDPQVVELRDKNQSYRMNPWSSSDPMWVGELDVSKLPVYQVVNWMRYSAYTPGAGPSGSNFTQSWLDDFNSFNSTRWDKGDWTFETNQAQLQKTNIVVKDGYLVLALTRPGEEGVKQAFPTDPLGSTYTTTAVGPRTSAKTAMSARATGSGLRIEGLAGYTGNVEIRDLRGNQLASTTMNTQGVAEIPFDRKGMFVVRAGESSASVIR